MAGPRTRQKLQTRSPQAIANAAKFGRGIGSFDIDQAWNQYGPGHGNLPDTYKGPLGNNPNYLGEPIHNPLFNINRNAPNLKFIQEPMNKDTPGAKFYSGKPRNYIPPYELEDPTSYKGDPDNIMLQMDQLRGMGEMDFVGSLDQAWGLETPGRQMEGIPQDYSHITDYSDYLNTLPVDQLQGLESLMRAKIMNA